MSSRKSATDWVGGVLDFWFMELSPRDWFVKNPDLDETILSRFGDLHERLTLAQPAECKTSPEAAVAAVIVLDQFSRNMFRGSPEMFSSDPLALSLAEAAIAEKTGRGVAVRSPPVSLHAFRA